MDIQLLVLDTLGQLDSLTSLPAAELLDTLRGELADANRLRVSPLDPYLAGVLKNGAEVFIDRVDLRKRIREFVEDPEKTVLLVDGEPGSGRSYTYSFIRHLSAHCGFRPVRVTLDQASTAEQVVQRLADFVIDPRTHISPLNPTRLNDPLPSIGAAVHRIVREATAAPEQFWLVLDECDKLDVNSDAWDCIGKLALAIYEHAPVHRAAAPRLVLLGYSATMRQLPYEIRKNEVRDTARITGADDLQMFFRQFFAEAAATAGPDDPAAAAPVDEHRIATLVETVVPAVLQAAEAPGEDSYMRKVCTAAEEAVRLYQSLGPRDDFGPRLRERVCAAVTAPAPAAVADLRKAYREAACLLTRFDPDRLRLPGEQRPTGKAALELVDDSRAVGTPAVDTPDGVTVITTSWVLKPEIRDSTLRGLAGPEQARLALLANMDHVPPGPGPERIALGFLSGTPPDLSRQTPDELPHTLEAMLWLALIPGISGIPDPAAVQHRLEHARLLQPLERLVEDSFQGRARELAELRTYIGLPPESLHGRLREVRQDLARAVGGGPEPPVVVHGPAGIGKSSLLAKFLLDSLRDVPSGFPFAYVDFERPTLSVHEPATLIAEMARQLGIQYPDRRTAFDDLARTCEETAGIHRAERRTVDELFGLSTTRATLGRVSYSGVHAEIAAREAGLARHLGELVVEAVGIPPREPQPPFVIVIDSFEEAQYRGSPLLGRLWAVWSALQEAHPRLRVIVSGRLLVEHPARVVEPRTIELGELDPEASVALLLTCGVTDGRLAAELAARVGGHPLSLKLAARAAVQEDDGTGALSELIESLPARRRQFFRKVDQLLVQGTLYERILQHIADDRVRILAQAGLALRTITPELVREVLAEPCGLRVESEEEAERLFGPLSRLDLLEPAGPGAVRHRADLRAIMLRPADRARADLMRTVGRRAVAYYAAREGPEARAEEIYHRLRLNENPRTVEERWTPGVERFLAGAGQDMAGRSAAYLAGHLGGHTPDEVMAEADQEDWERIAAREVEDLLAQEYTDAAAARLAERRPWTPGSPLHPLWVETLDRQGRRTEARAAADAAVDRAEQAGLPGLRLELLLLSARLAEADGDLGEASEDLAEAEEIATGLGRNFEAVGALLARARLGAGTGRADPEAGSRLADRLRRLPDEELLRQPALVRAAAAEVSHDHPKVLEHTLEVVGLPEAEEGALATLGKAIGRVEADRPDLRAALGRLLENALGPPDRAATDGGAPTGVTGILREAQRRGTLNRLARRLLRLDEQSPELVSGVAAAMGAGARTDLPAYVPGVADTAGTADAPGAPGTAGAPARPPAPANPIDPASPADPAGTTGGTAEGNGHRAA
ncbi:ATP-binding protein [Streptomyces sp. NPDC051211]|uniref:ATP-binding protein n=1 Tax=Streptomyces sp. NPDC051211 TaxID=3154643 RepID=UPI00344D62DF